MISVRVKRCLDAGHTLAEVYAGLSKLNPDNVPPITLGPSWCDDDGEPEEIPPADVCAHEPTPVSERLYVE